MRLLAVLLVLAPLAAVAAPEDPGPFAAASETDSIQVGPSVVSTLICAPNPLTGPAPLIAMATTANETTDVLQGLCLQYATYGFVVAAPALGFANTQAASIGQTLLDTLAFFVSENSRAASRYCGKLDVTHRGVVGFETGAMGAMQAAVSDDTLSVAIALDPYDLNGQARALAEQITSVPVMMARADPDFCNGQDSFATVYEALPGPASTLNVYDSNGCDVESPVASDCEYICTDPERPYAANLFLRYETAYAAYFVGCEQSMRTYIDGAGRQSDEDANNIVTVESQALPSTCGPYVVVDAGPPDAGSDSGTASGCGCGATSGAFGWALLLVPASAVRRRRRA